jgi:hypothetical protein
VWRLRESTSAFFRAGHIAAEQRMIPPHALAVDRRADAHVEAGRCSRSSRRTPSDALPQQRQLTTAPGWGCLCDSCHPWFGGCHDLRSLHQRTAVWPRSFSITLPSRVQCPPDRARELWLVDVALLAGVFSYLDLCVGLRVISQEETLAWPGGETAVPGKHRRMPGTGKQYAGTSIRCTYIAPVYLPRLLLAPRLDFNKTE